MERRSFLQNLTALGLIGIVPGIANASVLNIRKDKLPVHFVGLGASGSKIVDEFLHKNPQGYFTTIEHDTNLSNTELIKRISFDSGGNNFLKDSEFNHEVAKPLPNEIKNVFAAQQEYIILAPLGGKTGSLLASKLYAYLSSQNKPFKMIVSTPFYFEGPARSAKADYFLKGIKNDKRIYVINFQNLIHKYGNMLMSQGFEKGRELFHTTYRNQIANC